MMMISIWCLQDFYSDDDDVDDDFYMISRGLLYDFHSDDDDDDDDDFYMISVGFL